MPVATHDFHDWLTTVGLPTGTSELSKLLGVKRSTIQNQRVRGRIPETSIILASRMANVDPVEALGSFGQFAGLLAGKCPVTNAELLSQVTYMDALVELMSRSRTQFAHFFGTEYHLSGVPNDDSVRYWVDAVDPGDLRRQVTALSGIAASNFSAQLTDNRLSVDLAILISQICGVSTTSGLVASGLITPEEAGWPMYGRENALSELDDVVLIDLVTSRLAGLRRTTKKKADDTAANNHYLETLG